MKTAAAFLAAIFVLASAGAATAATRYDRRLNFRTISTARFDIHYHQGEEPLAQRMAWLAEEVATTLDRSLGPAWGRVQVILVDQNDFSNGWATPLPYNTIEISVATPAADSLIGNVDDWLRLVFIHEYVHIVHLSRAGGWIGGLRKVFGRLPLLYPNVYQPIWQIEGIATWQESAQTGGGRVPAGDFRLFLERAAAERRLEPLDRASSRIVDWPSGSAPYLYGAYFHQYLADRYGADALKRLTDETARRLPFFGSRAFRKVFGRSLGDLWKDFEAAVDPAEVASTTAERLTRHGFSVSGPRFADAGRVLYSLADPHGFPSLMELDLATRRSRAIATRYLGAQVGVAGHRAVFDQIEIVRDVGQQSDLYILDLDTRDTRRLSHGARAADPDVSSDGATLVFTVQRADRRELATAPLGASPLSPMALGSAADVAFASPRWSPDGTRIAAERRVRGGPAEIVVVDAASGRIDSIVPTGRNAGPVWSPDGTTILYGCASGGSPFRICAVPAAGGVVRTLEGTGPGALSPAVSPDGRSLVYVGYTADGYDLFSLPLASARWTAVPPADAAPPVAPEPAVAGALASRPYSPARTMLPQFWTPTVESDEGEAVVGAATGAVDALGRHAYGAEAGWSLSRARPDWQVGYAYDRWRPTFYAAVSDDTDPWRDGERRILEANAGMIVTSRRIRRRLRVLAEVHASRETFQCAAAPCAPGRLVVRRESVRGGLILGTARMFGYSISPEEGGAIGTTIESARSGSADGASSLSATVDARRYVRAWPRHAAVAVRAAAAASWGDEGVRRVFSASGSDAQTGGFRFGTDAVGLIRGVDEDRLFGDRAVVANLDYRLPLAHLERGPGTVPVFLRTVHAAAFLDAGHAWSGRFRSDDLRYSVGAELSADIILGYFAPLTLSAGSAWRRGPDPAERGFAAFARIGRAF